MLMDAFDFGEWDLPNSAFTMFISPLRLKATAVLVANLYILCLTQPALARDFAATFATSMVLLQHLEAFVAFDNEMAPVWPTGPAQPSLALPCRSPPPRPTACVFLGVCGAPLPLASAVLAAARGHSHRACGRK